MNSILEKWLEKPRLIITTTQEYKKLINEIEIAKKPNEEIYLSSIQAIVRYITQNPT